MNNTNTESRNRERKEAEEQRDQDIRILLGEQRFALYQRGRDGGFTDFYDLTEVFNLPERLAADAWQMRRAALETADSIRSGDILAPAQKREALRGIQAETRDSLSGLLGDEYFQAYERKVGDWIEGLSRPER